MIPPRARHVMTNRHRPTAPILLILGWALATVASAAELPAPVEEGFVPIFDGRTLAGWHASGKTGHSRASGNTSGGRWVVEEGAIIGSQDIPGNGGILITDAAYGDYEIALEMRNDFGPDSGLFLRSTEEGTAFQAMIDYHANGNLMGIYGEGKLGARPSIRNFSFRGSVTEIEEIQSPVPPSLPVRPASWPAFWHHGQWNELRARIVGNPPHITTWINGVRFCDWQETEIRHPDTGGIALQVHGGGDLTKQFVRYRNIRVHQISPSPDNILTEQERQGGWILLFDGKSHNGWMNSDRTPPRTPVEEGALNPHRAGHYMLVHTQQWSNFLLAVDFKITPHCNSGIFLRTSPLEPRPGKDVGYNGLEIAIDDTLTSGYHDTGALYDLAAPRRNAMRPIGEWNHIDITSRANLIEIVLNGEAVNTIDLSRFTDPYKRPDGSTHKFDIPYRDHPRSGYIGLQDHGSACWFKNIKLKPLPAE
ncbi:MAG TPA: hypothetical protein DCM86_06335 [Verrucomicrobiales bacterium]|nr:hypothetical protein [Verrucomicrobiales bacterium]